MNIIHKRRKFGEIGGGGGGQRVQPGTAFLIDTAFEAKYWVGHGPLPPASYAYVITEWFSSSRAAAERQKVNYSQSQSKTPMPIKKSCQFGEQLNTSLQVQLVYVNCPRRQCNRRP